MDRVEDHRLGWIDALRGYAILGVIIVHCGMVADGAESATSWGARGVQLFFVASAYALTGSYLRRREPVAAFYIRRLFRIAPMFWVAVAFYAGVSKAGLPVLALQQTFAPWKIWLTALLLHGFHPATINLIVPGDWSIAVELSFYAVFPLLMIVVKSWPRALALILVSVVYSMRYVDLDLHVLDHISPDIASALHSMWWMLLPTQFIAFASGIFAWWSTRPAAACRTSGNVAVVAAIVGLSFFSVYDSASLPGFSLLFGLLALGMAQGGGAWLNNAPARTIGKFSYSAYLVHFALLNGASTVVRGLELPTHVAFAATCFFVAASTLAISAVTYRLIEAPMIGLGNRLALALTRRRPQTPAPQDSAPQLHIAQGRPVRLTDAASWRSSYSQSMQHENFSREDEQSECRDLSESRHQLSGIE